MNNDFINKVVDVVYKDTRIESVIWFSHNNRYEPELAFYLPSHIYCSNFDPPETYFLYYKDLSQLHYNDSIFRKIKEIFGFTESEIIRFTEYYKRRLLLYKEFKNE
jgi:hypothetical protein